MGFNSAFKGLRTEQESKTFLSLRNMCSITFTTEAWLPMQ